MSDEKDSAVGLTCLEKLRGLMIRLGVSPGEGGMESFAANFEHHLYSTIRAANALLDGLACDTKSSHWRLIETAPKDQVILLWVPAFGNWIDGPWRGAWGYVANQWVLHTPFTAADGRAITVSEIPNPTHWMPLPVAANQRGGDENG